MRNKCFKKHWSKQRMKWKKHQIWPLRQIYLMTNLKASLVQIMKKSDFLTSPGSNSTNVWYSYLTSQVFMQQLNWAIFSRIRTSRPLETSTLLLRYLMRLRVPARPVWRRLIFRRKCCSTWRRCLRKRSRFWRSLRWSWLARWRTLRTRGWIWNRS